SCTGDPGVSATTFGWLILLFPLLGMIIISVSFRKLPGISAGLIGSLAIGLAFVAAVWALISIQGPPETHRGLTSGLWDYAVSAGVDARLSILVDPLSIFMALVVSGVGGLIHIYSIAYLKSDRGYNRFFAYLNYFVFSMLLLVLAGNFLLLIIGWAGVGAAS